MLLINIWFILALGYYAYINRKCIIEKMKDIFDLRKHSPSAIFLDDDRRDD